MSVSLNPSSSLGFNRPLTTLVQRTLTISNPNAQPVAFKVKTTAPKLYCVRPNSGRIEPGKSIDVSVMLQAMKEEPPLSAKCKDKFLIQSTLVTPEKETMALQDIWNASEGGEEAKVYQQKLKVVYLPAEGQALPEEDEGPAHALSALSNGVKYSTSHEGDGYRAPPIPDFLAQEHHDDSHIPEPALVPEPAYAPPADAPSHPEPARTPTPPADFLAAREEVHDDSHDVGVVHVTVHTPPSPPPAPPAPAEPSAELLAKYSAAQAEIERLRALLAAAPREPELRRRTRVLSDDGSVAETDIATAVDDGALAQEGVPLQVVVIIALGVFITTYLFF